MIKVNRIGNKLGVAGLMGIMLSVGMVINQTMTESSVGDSNQRAERQQLVGDSALRATVQLQGMQLATRGVRLAKTPGEVESGKSELQSAHSELEKRLEQAAALAMRQDNKDRISKVQTLTDAYSAAANELADLQLRILALNERRNAIAADWAENLKALLSLRVVAAAANRADIEGQLLAADGAFVAVRAAAWRFAATNETAQKTEVASRAATASQALSRVNAFVDDKAMRDRVEALTVDLKTYLAVTDDVMKSEEAKSVITRTRAVTIAGEANEIMGTLVSIMDRLVQETKAAASSDLAQASRINFSLAMVIVAALIGSIAFSFFGVARPLTRLTAALGRMAAGDLHVVIPGSNRGDEVGDMAKTVVVIRENAERKARDEAEAKIAQDRIVAEQRKRDMRRLADDFESAVGEIVETVSSASTELEASAGTLTSTAERAQELTTVVAGASEEASSNVQSVASATEEMASSVNEISRQVQESARIAHEAVEQAQKTNDRVSALSQAAARIGDVVELINTIAGQTNLLALNATIEAARAGEAGRGFAVVASEVKALAEQTAKATGEISQQIGGIQSATGESVIAIKEIGDTIGRMSEIASTIASAVEEQGAATQEISRNVQQAAQGTMQVSSNIIDVQRGAGETGSASAQVFSAAQSLSSESSRLKLEVGKFLTSVRAA